MKKSDISEGSDEALAATKAELRALLPADLQPQWLGWKTSAGGHITAGQLLDIVRAVSKPRCPACQTEGVVLHHFDCPVGKNADLTRPVRTSDCDCGVRLGQQHRWNCAFMRRLEANAGIVRCEHGVDRTRVTCGGCGVEGPLTPAALEDTVSVGDGPMCVSDGCLNARMHWAGSCWVCRSCGSTSGV